MRAGFAFLAAHWTKFLPGAVLAGVGGFVFAQAVALPTPGRILIGAAALMGTGVVYRAALFRYALRGEYNGMFGMRLSRDEGRLAGATALYSLFAGLVAITAAATALVVVTGVVIVTGDMEALAATSDEAAMWEMLSPASQVAARLALLAVLALLVFVAVRLCLYAPATIAEERVVLLEAWGWTRDSFWRLLAVLALASLPGFAWQYVLSGLAGAASAAGATGLAGALLLVGAFGGALVSGMLVAGALAFLYRGLRPSEPASG